MTTTGPRNRHRWERRPKSQYWHCLNCGATIHPLDDAVIFDYPEFHTGCTTLPRPSVPAPVDATNLLVVSGE